ncbi:MAG TPA: YbaB/EbfC family nucleoid-associated protein [Candidatus Baltobacteraceae bacterium]|nr:YbaB/EbfC family nucleoid-associated protein [Candidatus Baltobacteraceae bacterium]
MFSKLKQFKDLRDQAKKIQDVLKDVSVEGTAAWGKIKVVMNGNQEVTSVTIDPELLSDKGKLEDAMKEAYNDTVKKAQRAMADQMRKSGNLNLPGLN